MLNILFLNMFNLTIFLINIEFLLVSLNSPYNPTTLSFSLC